MIQCQEAQSIRQHHYQWTAHNHLLSDDLSRFICANDLLQNPG